MSSQDDFDYLFKTVIVGDSHVGKTQILSRFIDDQFTTDTKPTVGVDFKTKTSYINNISVKNQIWDTAGQQKYRALTSAYYKGVVGAIVVFDLTNHLSFEHIQKWIKQIKQHSYQGTSILLIGNKNDLQDHQVTQQEIQDFISNNKLVYLSTSAATGQNIEQSFNILIQDMMQKSGSFYQIKSTPDSKGPYQKWHPSKYQPPRSDISNSIPQISVNRDGNISSQSNKKRIEPFDVDKNKEKSIKIANPQKQQQNVKKRCC